MESKIRIIAKKKKYYKVGETIWVKPLKKTGKIVSLDTQEKVAKVNVVIDESVAISTVQEVEFMFWEIDKYHKPKKQKKQEKQEKQKALEIPVRYLTTLDTIVPGEEGFYELNEIEVGNWVDLRAAEDITMKAFEYRLIPLGFALELPKGYEGLVVPRSSTYKKWGIIQANHMGVIDTIYCGDDDQWYMSAIALRDTFIKRGSRICQFRIMPTMTSMVGKVKFKTVDRLGNKNRGGIGSTGG